MGISRTTFLWALTLGAFLTMPLRADEVLRPLAYQPVDTLSQTARLMKRELKAPALVGERKARSNEDAELAAGNLATLLDTVDGLDSVPTASSGGAEGLMASTSGVTFGRLDDSVPLRGLASPDLDDERTLEQVKQSNSYFSYRDFVVSHPEEWEKLRGDSQFVGTAERLFRQYAETDPNHRSREKFARFLNKLGPDTPTSVNARRGTGSAEKTH